MTAKRSPWAFFLSTLLCAVIIVPFFYVLLSGAAREGQWSLQSYYEVFFGKTEFLLRFWKSFSLSLCIAAAQTAVSTLAGYGFAKFNFPGKNALFFLMMVLMILPLQVTLMPNHILLQALGLIGTDLSLLLPAAFVPLGTFIMTQSFRSVPNSILEAALLDGCSTLEMIPRILLPANCNGFICTALLAFVDAWNMVEQPLTYLDDFQDYPISVALASVSPAEPTVLLACCVLVTLPPLFLFLLFNRELSSGIAQGGDK